MDGRETLGQNPENGNESLKAREFFQKANEKQQNYYQEREEIIQELRKDWNNLDDNEKMELIKELQANPSPVDERPKLMLQELFIVDLEAKFPQLVSCGRNITIARRSSVLYGDRLLRDTSEEIQQKSRDEARKLFALAKKDWEKLSEPEKEALRTGQIELYPGKLVRLSSLGFSIGFDGLNGIDEDFQLPKRKSV